MSKLSLRLTLDQLPPAQPAVVTDVATTGAARRRLMDLGILPGTRIEAVLTSPLGDPKAYSVRGALIALRRVQAREITVEYTPNVKEQHHDRSDQ